MDSQDTQRSNKISKSKENPIIIPSADFDLNQIENMDKLNNLNKMNKIRQSSIYKDHDSIPSISNIKTEKHIDKQSVEYILRSGLAGGLAGISAKTLIAPLDRIKILFQTNNPHYKQYVGSFKGMFKAINTIYTNDGIRGLYQGHSATLLRIFPYAAIKFVCYEQFRTILIPRDEYETAGRRLLAGSLAGVASVYCTYPLDLIRVRLAFETNHYSIHHGPGKLYHTLKLIYNEKPYINYSTGGYPIQSDALFARLLYNSKIANKFPWILSLSNFYRGFIPTILGMVPYAGVSFYSHDILHDLFRSKWLAPYTILNDKSNSATRSNSSFDHRPPLTFWAQLLAGGGAGMLAQASAYPFEVIRRRMQVGGVANKSGEFHGLSYTAKQIFKERGFRGFYVGLGIGFLKVIPMFACSFYVYERCKQYLLI
jgi:solute carrier family 25 protein 16